MLVFNKGLVNPRAAFYYLYTSVPFRVVDLHNARNLLSSQEYNMIGLNYISHNTMIKNIEYATGKTDIRQNILDSLIPEIDRLGNSKKYFRVSVKIINKNSLVTRKRITENTLIDSSNVNVTSLSLIDSHCYSQSITEGYSKYTGILDDRLFIKNIVEYIVRSKNVNIVPPNTYTQILSDYMYGCCYLSLKCGLLKTKKV